MAQRFYGDTSYEKILVAANGLNSNGGSAIVVGLQLIVPYSYYHPVEHGESWTRLAERFYGDGKRANVLMASNSGSPDKQPEEGSQLLIPFAVRHIADQRDDLAKISLRYYGSKSQAASLRRFNSIPRNRLARGQIVLVPLAELTLSDQGKKYIQEQSGSDLAAGDLRALQEKLSERLPKLREDVRRGKYIAALALGHEMLGSGALAVSQRIAVLKELATVYVALDEHDMAVKFFARALRLRPDLELDTAKTSPKVISALDKARSTYRKKR
ncbi:MAG: hypothetical protein IPJ88_03330 [Myxococcales bacterium]|nr:MAG: hypothetical protein IPJ88_03330 [Myxococcales bacterium]